MGTAAKSGEFTWRSRSFIFETRPWMVVKLVSMPPSQRWFTYGMPDRPAPSAIGSWACFLVPMNMIVPPSEARSRVKWYAFSIRSRVCCRSMM